MFENVTLLSSLGFMYINFATIYLYGNFSIIWNQSLQWVIAKDVSINTLINNWHKNL